LNHDNENTSFGIGATRRRDHDELCSKHAELLTERSGDGDSFGKPPSGTRPPGVTAATIQSARTVTITGTITSGTKIAGQRFTCQFGFARV